MEQHYENIRLPEAPQDFEMFWQSAVNQLEEIDTSISNVKQQKTLKDISLSTFEFDSLGDVRISGYFLKQCNTPNAPTVVYTHGYNAHCEPLWAWAKKGFNVIGYDTRGFGQSLNNIPLHLTGYILTGFNSPQESILKGAVLDAVQAIRVVTDNFLDAKSKLIHYGYSFGGAMALMAEAINPKADGLVIGVPTFGWHEVRLRICKLGSGKEIIDHLDSHPSDRHTILNTLNYFDSTHFAKLVKPPTIIGLGKVDKVVPAETVMPIAENLNNAISILEYPVSHSDDPREKEWANFESHWMDWAKQQGC